MVSEDAKTCQQLISPAGIESGFKAQQVLLDLIPDVRSILARVHSRAVVNGRMGIESGANGNAVSSCLAVVRLCEDFDCDL
jgi:hypothetical protein